MKIFQNFAENRLYLVDEFNIFYISRIITTGQGKVRNMHRKPFALGTKMKKIMKFYSKFGDFLVKISERLISFNFYRTFVKFLPLP